MDKNILIIDDEENLTYFMKEGLEQKGYSVQVSHSISEGRKSLKKFFPELLILDLNLPDGHGLDLYRELKSEGETLPTIIITAHSSIQSVIDAMKLGADDYITKPFDLNELTILVESMFERYRLKNQLNFYRRKAQCGEEFDFFISELPQIKEIQDLAFKISEVPISTVLIEGNTGTGKEMFARFIHSNSAQSDGPFVEINCASLQENLLESELFGFESGAFTDAKKRKIGLIELARGGTLFLDEIGEMSLALQAKLLRFLENHTFKRLGGVQDIKIEIRVIAATNRNIEKFVEQKKFREDLFFRLNLFRIKLPPLNERKEETLLIAQFMLEKINIQLKRSVKFISEEAKEIILNYNWPGNFRELHNVLERAVILNNSDTITADYLPTEIRKVENAVDGYQPKLSDLQGLALKDYLAILEGKLFKQALEISDGNQVKAAKLLNEPRHIIRYLTKKHIEDIAEN
jgi:two-component system response regulator AtoC